GAFGTSADGDIDPQVALAQIRALASECAFSAQWLRMRADKEVIADHVDRFFADRVLGVLAADFTEVSKALTAAADQQGSIPRAGCAAASPAGVDRPRRTDLLRTRNTPRSRKRPTRR
ncbi:MAG TPA: hypothetical protein VIJ00_17005, partial [Nakamurella sp.]